MSNAHWTSFLQTRFGLRRPEDARPMRIAKYLSGLRHLDDGNRFYSKLFSADPWSTTEHLLMLRDDLIAAGWNGEPTKKDDEILEILAQVEELGIDFYCRSTDGLSEPVRTAARSTRRCELHKIVLATDIQVLPFQWQKLLQNLEHTSGFGR